MKNKITTASFIPVHELLRRFNRSMRIGLGLVLLACLLIQGRLSTAEVGPDASSFESANARTSILKQGKRVLSNRAWMVQDGDESQNDPRTRLGRMLTTFGTQQQCSPVSISPGQPVTGTLTSTDCPNQGFFADIYTFTGTSGQEIAILLSSTNFDTVLGLGFGSQVVRQDDNGGGGTNSRIPAGSGTFRLAATGQYIIIVTSRNPGQSGNYQIQLTSGGGGSDPCQALTPISFGQELQGQLTSSDCRAPNGSYLDRYGFTGTAGQQIAITLNSSQINAFLLLGVNNTQVQQDNDGGGGTNARIPAGNGFFQLPTTGNYVILATSSGANETGAYTLRLTTNTPPPPPPGGDAEQEPNDIPQQANPLNVPGTRTGSAGRNDASQITIPFEDGSSEPVPDLFVINLAQSARLELTLAFTSAADLDLILFTASGEILDASFGLGSTELITTAQPLAAGTYYVGVGAFSGSSTYTLTAAIPGGSTCTYSLSQPSASVPSSGGTGSVTVTTQSGCAWTVANVPSWVTITSGNGGSGSGQVNYSAQANTSANQRQATLTIAGQSFTLTQSGASSCSYSILPATATVASSGGTGSVTVTTQSGCAWTVANVPSWVTITSGNGGSGSGQVNYSAQANTSANQRQATLTIAGQSFTLMQSGTAVNTNRIVRVVDTSGAPGGEVSVPITIEAQGDEVGVQFSLDFNPAQLTYLQADAGADVRDILAFPPLAQNVTMLNQGKLGLGALLNRALASGRREVAVVKFRISAAASGGQQLPLGFSDAPTRQRVTSGSAQVLDANFIGGVVTVAQGFEGDINNDGDIDLTDAQLAILHLRGTGVIAPGAAFQRGDCSPKSAKGDGFIEIEDVQQILLFLASSERIPVGGPQGLRADPPLTLSVLLDESLAPRWRPARRLRIEPEKTVEGEFPQVVFEAWGGESAISFSLNFDPGRLRFTGAAVGEDVGEDLGEATFIVNSTELDRGRVGIALLLPPGRSLRAGAHRIVKLSFSAADDAEASLAQLSFGQQPLARRVIDDQANVFDLSVRPAFIPVRRGGLALVSANDYRFDGVAAESLVAAFGAHLAAATASADSESVFALAGTTVRVRDRFGIERAAPLSFVSQGQINFQIPSGTASGPATVFIGSGDGRVLTGLLQVIAAR